jgi:hypothetical protein
MAVAKQASANRSRLEDLIPAVRTLKESPLQILILYGLISGPCHIITIIKSHKGYAGHLVTDRIPVLIIQILIQVNILLHTITSTMVCTRYA